MRLSDRAVAALVALGLAALYCAGPLRFQGNDTRPAVYTAVSLAKRGDFDLDEFAGRIRGARSTWPYFVSPTVRGSVVSRFGPAVPLVVTPLFGVALAARGGRMSEHLAGMLGRAAAALLVAGAAALVFLSARRLGASRREALALSALYGLGTCAFSVASQALWQHGPAQFFIALGLWALLAGGRSGHALGGLAFAVATTCRPPDAPFALAATAYVVARAWRHERASIAYFVAPAACVASLQFAYNHWYFGAPWAFAQTAHIQGADALANPSGTYWGHNPLAGLAGLFVSPSHGLFASSPMLALLALRWRTVRAEAHPLVLALLGGFALLCLVMSRYYGWYGGWGFGYRMIGDGAPVLCLALLPVLREARARPWLVALAAVAAVIQALGAFNYSPIDWDAHPDVGAHLDRLWSLRDSQIVYVLTHRASPDTW